MGMEWEFCRFSMMYRNFGNDLENHLVGNYWKIMLSIDVAFLYREFG